VVDQERLSEESGRSDDASVEPHVVTLDELLAIDSGSDLAGPVGFTGRFLSLGGSLIALGVPGFALFVGGQSSLEAWTLNQLVRAAAGMTIMGAVVEALGLFLALSNVGDALVGSAGVAGPARVWCCWVHRGDRSESGAQHGSGAECPSARGPCRGCELRFTNNRRFRI